VKGCRKTDSSNASGSTFRAQEGTEKPGFRGGLGEAKQKGKKTGPPKKKTPYVGLGGGGGPVVS